MSFVLRFEFENVSSINNRTADSIVLDEEGFEWTATFRPHPQNSIFVDFSLNCEYPTGGEWRWEADVEWIVGRGSNPHTLSSTRPRHFKLNNYESDQWMGTDDWSQLIDPDHGFVKNDKLIIEFHLNNFRSECENVFEYIVDLEKFLSLNKNGNVVLVIGDQKVTVSKEFLAVHSPVFAAMFFKNYAEKGKDEVEIKDVVYEEFLDVLDVVFPVHGEIRYSTVLHVLELADRFQMKQVFVYAEAHLQSSKKFTSTEKLRIADAYRLEKLTASSTLFMDQCLKTYSAVRQIETLEATPEYAEFSPVMKDAIRDRVMKLKGECTEFSPQQRTVGFRVI